MLGKSGPTFLGSLFKLQRLFACNLAVPTNKLAGQQHMEFDPKTRKFIFWCEGYLLMLLQRSQILATRLHSLSSLREIDGP